MAFIGAEYFEEQTYTAYMQCEVEEDPAKRERVYNEWLEAQKRMTEIHDMYNRTDPDEKWEGCE